LTPVVSAPVEVDAATVTDDFEYARGNMIAAIEKGQEALNGVLEVAGMSQQPRAYEVAATLLKSLADANKDLLELSKKKKDLLKQDETKGPSTVNNNMFVGNAAELLKMIKSNGV
jgi:Terminase DNA packaging enzyme